MRVDVTGEMASFHELKILTFMSPANVKYVDVSTVAIVIISFSNIFKVFFACP